MNTYTIINKYEIGTDSENSVKANTPFDAAEKATRHISWREKERLVKQVVMVLDGSKKTWEFEK